MQLVATNSSGSDQPPHLNKNGTLVGGEELVPYGTLSSTGREAEADTWFPIELFTLSVWDEPPTNACTTLILDPDGTVRATPGDLVKSLEKVYDFLKSRPGKVLKLQASGFRGASSSPTSYSLRDVATPFVTRDPLCLQVSLMNAAMALGIPRERVVECTTSACDSIAFANTI